MDRKVSVVTPAYNRAHFLGELVQFMQRQTYKNWELIIVDDGSEDDTEEIITDARQQDNRIKFYRRRDPPKGAARCRNIGVQNATGNYIIFLDSDDLLASFALEQRVRYMEEHPDLDFAVFYGLKFNTTPGDCNIIVNKEIDSQNTLEAFLSRNYPWHTSAPIWKRNSLLQKELYWDEKLSIFQDVDFHIRALLEEFKFDINTQARPDYFWRVHEDDKVSSYKSFPVKFDSCSYFLTKLGNLLKTYDKLNEETERYLVRFFFSTSRILTMENELGKGLWLWHTCYRNNYMQFKEYTFGKLWLHGFNLFFPVFGSPDSKFKNKIRELYYKVIPTGFDQDKDVLLFDKEIKI